MPFVCNLLSTYVTTISGNFNLFKKFECTIEILEGCMDVMETLEEKAKAETCLIQAYIECGEFLKAKAANEKRRSIDIHDCLNVAWQSARIEEGLCNSFSETDHGIFFNRHHKVIFLFAYFTTNGIQLRVLYYSIMGTIIHLFLLRRPHIEYTLSRINAIFLC